MTKPVEIHQENTLHTPKYTISTQIYNGNSGAGHVKLANRNGLANFTFPIIASSILKGSPALRGKLATARGDRYE